MESRPDSINYRAITDRQQATWATGDFNELARQIVGVSETLCRAVDPRPGQRVLDVACGSGNAAEGTKIDFRVADAQELPFADASFDVVLSVFGVMFAPDQERAAREILRVCRPGGRIGLATWPPSGIAADSFKTVGQYVPPPPGLKPPTRWGTETGLAELLGGGTSALQCEPLSFFQYFRSVDHALEVFRAYFGPTSRAFQAVDAGGQEALRNDLLAIYRRYDRAADGTAAMEAEYRQVVATRA
jgi:SAM-dependent methyltransferase